MLASDAERPAARRPRRRRRHRPDRDRGDLLGRAGEVAPRVLSRARVGLGPSPREARDRGLPRRARVSRLRLVPHRPEPHARRLILAALISYPRAILLGLLQGVSELFPISSLGHSVILPRLLGWNIHQNDKYFLTFLVATHLATALVLLGFFWRDWVRILKGIGRSLRDRGIDPGDADAKLGCLLATPIIGAAAILKLPELFGSAGNGVRGQALVGALCSAVTAYLAVRFLMRFFETQTLVPFAVYCFLAGLAATIYFAVS